MKITVLVLCLCVSGLVATPILDQLYALGITAEILSQCIGMEVGEMLSLHGIDIRDLNMNNEELMELVEMEVGELLE